MLAIAVGFLAPGAAAADVAANLGADIDYSCAQPTAEVLACRYRPLLAGELRGVSARLDEIALKATPVTPYPQPDSTTAILLVVDLTTRGDDQRLEVLRTLLAQARAHHRLGLATFDDVSRLTLAPGASLEELAAATHTLGGAGSAAYRDLMEAIRTLAGYAATRKAIYFLSEGRGAPEGYYHPDLLRAAREAQVVFYAFVYSDPASGGPGVEALGRLSRESGGELLRVDPRAPSLPGRYAAEPYASIDGGGQFNIDLAPAIRAGRSGSHWVVLDLEVDEKRIELPVPITIAGAAPGMGSTGPAIATGDYELGLTEDLLILVAAGALIAALAAGLYYFRRSRMSAAVSEPDTLKVPRAYLVRQGEPGSRIWVSKVPWRIGRGKGNDLVVAESSMSRHHAEIVRGQEGGFEIKDLDSLNGLFVNERKVRTAPIADGAEIDFGDVRFVFKVETADHAAALDQSAQ